MGNWLESLAEKLQARWGKYQQGIQVGTSVAQVWLRLVAIIVTITIAFTVYFFRSDESTSGPIHVTNEFALGENRNAFDDTADFVKAIQDSHHDHLAVFLRQRRVFAEIIPTKTADLSRIEHVTDPRFVNKTMEDIHALQRDCTTDETIQERRLHLITNHPELKSLTDDVFDEYQDWDINVAHVFPQKVTDMIFRNDDHWSFLNEFLKDIDDLTEGRPINQLDHDPETRSKLKTFFDELDEAIGDANVEAFRVFDSELKEVNRQFGAVEDTLEQLTQSAASLVENTEPSHNARIERLRK